MPDAGFRNFKCLNRGGLQRRGCREAAKPRIGKDEFAMEKSRDFPCVLLCVVQIFNFLIWIWRFEFSMMKFPLSISSIFKWRRLLRRLQDWFSRQKSRAFFWRAFFWRDFFWSSITARELCSHQCLWSGFIFPELEHLYKNVRPLFQKEAFEIWGVPSFPKREHVRAVMYPPDWARISSRFISRVYWMT